MKFFLSKISIFLGFFLFLGYILLDKNIYSVLFNWKTISPEGYAYNLESLRENFRYSAENVFDPGYVREVDSVLSGRLSVYPANKSLEGERLVIPAGLKEGIVKIVLPEEFKSGALSIRVAAKSKFEIGTSFDLKDWKFHDYPGFTDLVYNMIYFESKNLTEKYVYLKFIPFSDEGLEVSFNVFQYLSSLAVVEKADYGVLFYPEIDVDYEGKQIIQPGIIYDARKNKTAN